MNRGANDQREKPGNRFSTIQNLNDDQPNIGKESASNSKGGRDHTNGSNKEGNKGKDMHGPVHSMSAAHAHDAATKTQNPRQVMCPLMLTIAHVR